MKKFNFVIILLIGVLFIFSAEDLFAFAIDVNGNLDEWGVSPDQYGSPVNNLVPYSGISYVIGDSSEEWPDDIDPIPSPGAWGYPYDVEAMYLTTDSSNLYFAVVTTFPSSGWEDIVTGDLAFDFGINSVYEYGISSITRDGYNQGTLYDVSEWNDGWWGLSYPETDPSYIKIGTEKYDPPLLNLAYNSNYYYTDKGRHYVIEGYMPQTAFGGDWGKDFRMHWAMSCGNDFLDLDYNGNGTVPEPATMSLLGLGVLGLLGLRGRKVTKTQRHKI